MYIFDLCDMILIFLFWGVVGWCIEVVTMRIIAGEFQNRGFLHLPLCPIYGVGMVLMSMLFHNHYQDYVILFFSGMIVASTIEFLTSWILEKLFCARWWDYSHMKFQYKGRICLRNTILFGFGAIITIGFIEPWLEGKIGLLSRNAAGVTAALTAVVFLVDFGFSLARALRYRRKSKAGKVFFVFKTHR